MKPTDQYIKLDLAYDYYNKKLFQDKLPKAFLILNRRDCVVGHYGPKRFEDKTGGGQLDEICLNPDFFFKEEAILATLVHEMAHQWQQHHGKTSRGGYHNAQWGRKMESIGLMPSDTGKPGGKKFGQQMDHYIMDGGKFQKITKQLLKSKKIIDWISLTYESQIRIKIATLEDGYILISGEDVRGLSIGDRFSTGYGVYEVEEIGEAGEDGKVKVKVKTIRGIDGIEDGTEGILKRYRAKKKNKIKYTCPDCGLNVWGKPDLRILCCDCSEHLEESY